MDRPDVPAAEMADALTDIGRLNLIGATQTIQRHVAPFFSRIPRGDTLRILDVGTGGADIPLVGRILSASNTWQLGATEEMRVEGPNRTSAQVGGFSTCP